MNRVVSQDGTPIAYERQGTGPAVILVGGGLDDGSENVPLAAALAEHFATYNYARRGRGESGDTQPYAVEREIEDIAALIATVGGTADLFGVSTGGALVLEAAASGLPGLAKLAVYEVPYNVADDWRPRWREYVDQVNEAVAVGRRDDALAHFLRLTGASADDVAAMRQAPFWMALTGLAHTLPYDAACLGDGQPPRERLGRITQPTLVATGGGADQPEAAEWVVALAPAADAIVDAVPGAERRILAGQGHVVDPAVMAAELRRFFGR
jgi:pimeloyl-ACP methyl ester carboxylesterase